MTGGDLLLGLKRVWQSLLVQLLCQALLVAGFVAGDMVASWSGSYELGYGMTLVVTTACFVAQMVAWVEIVGVLGRFKAESRHFSSASNWYLVSFCLVFAYFAAHGIANALEEAGMSSQPVRMAESIVAALKFVTPIVAISELMWGYADYLDALGMSQARLTLLRVARISLVVAVIEAVLSLPLVALAEIAPDSAAYATSSLLLALTYVLGFIVQAVAVAVARFVWRTVEGILE